MSIKTEIKTLDTSATLFNFLQALDFADQAETSRFNETEKALSLLKVLRGHYSTLQHGNAKAKAKAGELPNSIYKPVIQSLYDAKQKIALNESKEFTLRFDSYRDFQVKSLKFYIETGDLFNRKKDTLQERALIAIDKLDKKLAAESAKLDKAKQAADKAAADKAAADAQAAQVNAESEQIIEEVCIIIDDDPQGASAVQSELLGVIDDAQAAQAAADTQAAQAAADKAAADKVQVQAQAAADKTKKELDKVKAKLANLSAPKAENNKSEPKLDFKVLNFSQDCKDTASMILEELERETTSVPELLYLAKLILDKYNK
jgi:hypothetical protein